MDPDVVQSRSAEVRNYVKRVRAVQLRWDTWNQVCGFVGEFTGETRGVYVDIKGEWHDKPPTDKPRIGLLLQTDRGIELAVEGDYIVKERTTAGHRCYPVNRAQFEIAYEEAR